MKHYLHLVFLFLMVGASLFALDAKVNVYVKPYDTIYTSQKVTVAVELMTDAFSITDARISFPPSQDYIVQAPQSASYLRTIDVNGTDWQMVHYEYEVYTLKSGELDIPPMEISFSASMGYGQEKKNFTLQSDALQFLVKSPEGVKGSTFVLITKNYSLEYKNIEQNKTFIVGDALNFSVTQKAKDVPDVLLQPVVYTSNAYVRVYDKEPELRNGLKGDHDVSRTDAFTFVANAEGNGTLEAQTLTWWNSDTKTLMHEKIPAIHFEIIADPQIAIDAKKEAQNAFLFKVLTGLIAGLGLFFLVRKKMPALLFWMKQKKLPEHSLDKTLNP